MVSLQKISVLIGLILSSFLLSTEGSPYVISDDRVRSLDITPVLGRGYSIMTNSYQSTCLLVSGVTVPSYNYDYSFYDMTSTEDSSSKGKGPSQVRFSFAYYWLHRSWSKTITTPTSSKVQITKRSIVSSMRIERYYASVREEVSPLSSDALTLLDRRDYVGFFKACGPNFIRGIRRAQEVVALFEFTSTSQSSASEFTRSMSSTTGGGYSGFLWWRRRRPKRTRTERTTGSTKFSEETKDMTITIKGYGLGLGHKSAETLVATNIQEYREVMKTAFRIMTQNKDSFHIGQVYGIEIMPWVDNTAFQVAANVQDEVIEIPMARSLIPEAICKTGETCDEFANDSATRNKYTCKDETNVIDKFGYCCEPGALYLYETDKYDATNSTVSACRPLRTLDRSIIKNNMASNGEFVARLDRAVRYKLNKMSTLERCISAARAIPSSYDYYILRNKDTVKYDGTLDAKFTVMELKIAIDPFNDYSMVEHLGKELDEFIDMFYAPCLAALFGSNIGSSADTDPSYFMAYPWHTHDECLYLSCFGMSMRWDRTSGGCTPGIIAGSTNSAGYTSSTPAHCTIKDGAGDASGNEECKYAESELKTYYDKVKKCWDGGATQNVAVSAFQVDYLMDHFCMPELSGERLADRPGLAANTLTTFANEVAANCPKEAGGD